MWPLSLIAYGSGQRPCGRCPDALCPASAILLASIELLLAVAIFSQCFNSRPGHQETFASPLPVGPAIFYG